MRLAVTSVKKLKPVSPLPGPGLPGPVTLQAAQ
jgi:hypothetical protein